MVHSVFQTDLLIHTFRAPHQEGKKLDLDKERRVRTPEEMANEAAELRVLF